MVVVSVVIENIVISARVVLRRCGHGSIFVFTTVGFVVSEGIDDGSCDGAELAHPYPQLTSQYLKQIIAEK